MLYTKSERLEDVVVRLLLGSPKSVKEIGRAVQKEGVKAGERAVYKAVGHLLQSEVLLKAGKRVRINEEWLHRLEAGLALSPLPELAPGERVSYTFSSIEQLDSFYKTIALGLERYEQDGQVFFYNPHNFWAYIPARQESEVTYYRHFSERKRHAFFTVGGETKGDFEFKRSFQDEYLQIDLRPIAQLGRNAHITVLGDHVITVRFSKAVANHIDDWYRKLETNEELSPRIMGLLGGTRFRFILEHNPLKAKKLRRILSRNFYFKVS